jgi:hypothetical protein
MPKTLDLPVLPLADEVVLPGMVAPIALDQEAQAAIDAARSAADSQLLLVPRVEGAYGANGVLAVIEQVGRLPDGKPAAVVRGLQRARIGAGVSGAGAALWVQATLLDDSTVTDHTRELASAYKALVVSILQHRGAWQVVDNVQRMTDPALLSDTAGYAPYLDLEQKLWLLGNPDVDARLEKLIEWGRTHLAELEVSARGSRRASVSSCCASSWPRSARSSARTSPMARRTTGPAWRARTCRTRCVRRRCARWRGSSGAATRAPKPAGSARGSTRCWSSHGAPVRRTAATSLLRELFSTPTTRVSTT